MDGRYPLRRRREKKVLQNGIKRSICTSGNYNNDNNSKKSTVIEEEKNMK